MSTDEQADSGLGIDAQRASIAAAVRQLGVGLRAVHVDEGSSGALAITKRPVLMQAVSAAQRGDVLLVARRDRLARDVFEMLVIERWLKKRGARILSAAGEGTSDDEPASVLFRGVIDLFAQFERLLIRARTKAALVEKRGRGERVGTVPYGSQLAADGVHVEPAPAEQRIVAQIRDLRAAGHSTRQIAAVLRSSGVTTRRGSSWRFQDVARLLWRA